MYKQTIGKIGEQLACKFLHGLGYKLLDRNYLIRQGEIDIVAQKKDVLVFVEVKTRKSDRFGTAAEAVTWRKRQSIMLTALNYIQVKSPCYKSYQFDVIEVYLDKDNDLKLINHIENAFSYD